MIQKVNHSVRNQIVICSKEGLSQFQIMERLNVSQRSVHETQKWDNQGGHQNINTSSLVL